MSEEKNIKRNRMIALRPDVFEVVAEASKRAGYVKETGEPDVYKYLNDKLPSFGLETDEVKFVFKVPKNISEDNQQLKLFLQAQVEKAVKQLQ